MKATKFVCFAIVLSFLSACTQSNQQPTTGYQLLNELAGDSALLQSAQLQGPGVHVIKIEGMKFVPEKISVHSGDTLLWINNDIFAHDVTESNEQSWSSPRLESGSSWAMIVSESSNYFCSIHVVMKGSIQVKSAENS